MHHVCSTVVKQYLLSLFCLSVTYWFISCPLVEAYSDVTVVKVLYCYPLLFFKIVDTFLQKLLKDFRLKQTLGMENIGGAVVV